MWIVNWTAYCKIMLLTLRYVHGPMYRQCNKCPSTGSNGLLQPAHPRDIFWALLCVRTIFDRSVREPFFSSFNFVFTNSSAKDIFLNVCLSPKISLSLSLSCLQSHSDKALWQRNFDEAQFLVGAMHWRVYYAHFLTQFSGKCNGWGIYANVFYAALLSDTFARKNSCSFDLRLRNVYGDCTFYWCSYRVTESFTLF